jgi:hypothetical protein
MWDNLKACLSMRWPIGYLVRDILDNQLSHSNAVDLFKTASLVAPCYITIVKKRRSSGIKLDDDGLIIQRDHYPSNNPNDSVILLGKRKTLTQTNIDQNCEDPDKDILWSINRRYLADAIGNGLLELGRGTIEIQKEFHRTKILEKYMVHPIKNHETRYISLLAPCKFDTNNVECLDSRFVILEQSNIQNNM